MILLQELRTTEINETAKLVVSVSTEYPVKTGVFTSFYVQRVQLLIRSIQVVVYSTSTKLQLFQNRECFTRGARNIRL